MIAGHTPRQNKTSGLQGAKIKFGCHGIKIIPHFQKIMLTFIYNFGMIFFYPFKNQNFSHQFSDLEFFYRLIFFFLLFIWSPSLLVQCSGQSVRLFKQFSCLHYLRAIHTLSSLQLPTLGLCRQSVCSLDCLFDHLYCLPSCLQHLSRSSINRYIRLNFSNYRRSAHL